MKKTLFILALYLPFLATAQTEPQAHPAQIGAYGATAGQFLRVAATPSLGAIWSPAATVAQDLGPLLTLNPSQLAQQGATTGQVLKWNGSAWAPGTDNAGSGGDNGSLIGGAGITLSGTAPAITITAVDQSATNELQTIGVAANTITLSNAGGTATVAGAGINTVSTSGTTITVTGTEVDGSTSNELQTITRNAGTNNVTASINSSTATVRDLWEYRTVTFTPGQSTITVSGTMPANLADLKIYRNGQFHRVGATGCSGCNIAFAGSVGTLGRSTVTGETFEALIAIQN